MGRILAGSVRIPDSSMIWPKNFTDETEVVHFSLLSVTPDSCSRLHTALRYESCSSLVLPKARQSSMRQITSSKPSKICYS